MTDTDTHILIWILIAVGVGYDVLATIFVWPTISQGVREIDVQSGTLLRWAMVALLCHWFLPSPWGGWNLN